MVLSMLPAAAAAEPAGFYDELAARYSGDAANSYGTEVRWWLPGGGYTDETIVEEINWLYDNGFRGFELCLLNTPNNNVYAYGSQAWADDVKLAISTAVKLGMRVGLTSGTHWQAANVPGMDPNAESAGQEAGKSAVAVKAGETVVDLTRPNVGRGYSYLESAKETGNWVKQTLIGVYAYPIISGKISNGLRPSNVVLDYAGLVDLTDKVVIDGDRWYLDGGFTAEGKDYALFVLAQQGNFQKRSPSQEAAYDINYYNKPGVEALTEFLSSYIFNDPEMVELVKEGDVQIFMDSLEINNSDGSRSMYWAADMADEFMARKGYDIRPYLPLLVGIGTGSCFVGTGQDVDTMAIGGYALADAEGNRDVAKTWRIINDLYDVQTQLMKEEMTLPLQEWGLANFGVPVRTQAPYGTYTEISEMPMAAKYVETESLNMKDQVDLYRVWSGTAHIQNKLYSSETAGQFGLNYALTEEDFLRIAYDQFAGGVNRTIWHGHSSEWGPVDGTKWPGFEGMGDSISGRLASRDPSSKDYPAMNAHLSRVQRLLQDGNARTDVGILHLRYGENTAYPFSDMNAMREHRGLIWQDIELQEAGYTYDYFSPQYLEEMDYTEEGLGQNVRYQALIVHQEGVPVDNAKTLLDLAKEGLPVLLMPNAGAYSPYQAEDDAELKVIFDELKTLPNVVSIAGEAEALETLQAMGIYPRVEMVGGSEQLLSQVRQDGDDRFLFLYNFCDGSYTSENESYVANTNCDHGPVAVQELSVEGTVVPYYIDSWTGDIEKVANYRWENGRTFFTVEMDYCTVELFAFEAVTEEEVHVTDADVDVLVKDGKIVARATETGTYNVALNDGSAYNFNVTVPAAQSLGNWDLVVEDWQQGERIYREETEDLKVLLDDGSYAVQTVTTREEKYTTSKNEIKVHLDELKYWNEIEEIGKNVSGIGTYTTTVNWDANAADGAYLDLGWISHSASVKVNGVEAEAVDVASACIDLNDLLVDGENTLEICVSAPLTNRLLEMGRVREGVSGTHRMYAFRYFPNGLASVELIPYVEASVSDCNAAVTLSGPDAAILNDDTVEYTVSASGAENLATATLTFAVEGYASAEVVPAEGWAVLTQSYEAGELTAVLYALEGTSNEAVASVTAVIDEVGAASVELTEAVLSAYFGTGETFVNVVLGETLVETEVNYHPCDVNRDGVVDQLDITRAQRFFGTADEVCDVTADGIVNTADMIMILNNYIA